MLAIIPPAMSRFMLATTPPEINRPYAIVRAETERSVMELDPRLIAELYKRDGALLFRGFAVDLEEFDAFAGQFCATSVFNDSPGRQVLDAARNIQSVNLGTEPFPLHPELSREPWKPDACFFLCLQPPRGGGMTTVCDGVELVRQMPDEIRDGLAGRRLVYMQPGWPELFEYWLGTATPNDLQLASPPPGCPYRFARANGQVRRIFSRPALHRPMFTDALAFGNFLLFARYFGGRSNFPVLDDGAPVPAAWMETIKALGDRLAAPIAWEKGDLVMLDNSRFMHGRTEITEPRQRLIASYFGYLNFALPDPEEPIDPIWRRTNFRPPVPPAHPRAALRSAS